MFLKKKKKKEDEYIEPGTYKHFYKMKTMSPMEIYRQRLDYLKRKKKEKEDGESKSISQSRK